MDRETQIAVVEQFFEGPPDLDRLSLLHDDCDGTASGSFLRTRTDLSAASGRWPTSCSDATAPTVRRAANVDRTSASQQRIAESVAYLHDHLHEVPVLCVPLVAGRTDGNGEGAAASRTSAFWQASRWGSIVPVVWSFMLALRSRGLGLRVDDADVGARARGGRASSACRTSGGCRPACSRSRTRSAPTSAPTPRQPGAEFLRWNGF